MACSACAKRRKKLLEKLAAKKAKRQTIQAAAIGAVLTVTEKVGNAIGLSGEESEDDKRSTPNHAGSSNSEPAGSAGIFSDNSAGGSGED